MIIVEGKDMPDWMIRSAAVLQEVFEERRRQYAKRGEQNLPNGTGGEELTELSKIARESCEHAFQNKRGTWRDVLSEEHCEALAESDPFLLRGELIQVAAVAVQWCEALDRQAAKA